MGAYFAMAGCKVTVLELLPKIAGEMDAEISALLQKGLEAKGIVFHLGARAAAFADGCVMMEQNGETIELPCDKVLLSVGRKASTAETGLEVLGVATDRGNITVDDRCLTNIPNVYAVGDCNGKSMLAHTAYRQAEVAVNNILGREDCMSYRAVPSVVYTNPEVASVGLTREAARKTGLETADITLSMNFAGRYVAENERGEGISKLVFDKNRRTHVGAHIIGGPASEFILSCGILIETELPLEQMKRLIFPHPTVCEIIREGMFQIQL
jgi:dihydrolipoamide dehydrogenase